MISHENRQLLFASADIFNSSFFKGQIFVNAITTVALWCLCKHTNFYGFHSGKIEKSCHVEMCTIFRV